MPNFRIFKKKADKEIRAIIIGAGEEVFCMGTDGKEFRSFEKRSELLEQFSIVSKMSQFDYPTIVAINGDAFGHGLKLRNLFSRPKKTKAETMICLF